MLGSSQVGGTAQNHVTVKSNGSHWVGLDPNIMPLVALSVQPWEKEWSSGPLFQAYTGITF